MSLLVPELPGAPRQHRARPTDTPVGRQRGRQSEQLPCCCRDRAVRIDECPGPAGLSTRCRAQKGRKAERGRDEPNHPVTPMSTHRASTIPGSAPASFPVPLGPGACVPLPRIPSFKRWQTFGPITHLDGVGRPPTNVQVPPARRPPADDRASLAPPPPCCPLLPAWPSRLAAYRACSPLLDLDWHVPFCFIRHLQPVSPSRHRVCDSSSFSLPEASVATRPSDPNGDRDLVVHSPACPKTSRTCPSPSSVAASERHPINSPAQCVTAGPAYLR